MAIIHRFFDKDSERSRWLTVALIAIFLIAFYLLTFSPYPTSDGLAWAVNIEQGRPDDIRSAHLLYEPLGYIIYHTMLWVGWHIEPILLLQVMNAVMGTVGVIFFSQIVFSVTKSWRIAAIAAGLLAISHSYWFFLDCECHVFALAFVIMAFYALLRKTDRSLVQYALVGFLHSLAILFHQDNLVFAGVVIAAIFSDEHLNVPKWKVLAVYALVGVVLVGIPYLVVGWFAFGCRIPLDYWQWQTKPVSVITTYHASSAPFFSDLVVRVGRLLKGQGVGFTVAVDAFVDLFRNHPQYVANERVILLLTLLGLCLGLLAYFALVLFRNWSFLRQKYGRVILLAFVWIILYKTIVNSWWVPGWPEYHVTGLPPLLLLLALTWLDFKARVSNPTANASLPERRVRLWLALGLLFVVLGANFLGAIWPWRQFGRNAVQTAHEMQSRSTEQDLFLTTDSSVSLWYWGQRDPVSLKALLISSSDSNEAFDQARQDIAQTLDAGHQVFIYALQPNSLKLDNLNGKRQSNGFEPVSSEIFTDFLLDLGTDYQLHSVLRYWEWQIRYDTFGNRAAVFQQVTLLE